MLAENVLFRAVSKKAENVSRIRFSANSCEQKTKEAPFERGFLLTKAEGCFANSQRLSANRIPLKFAFPGGFEPPTFRLGFFLVVQYVRKTGIFCQFLKEFFVQVL